ncbi:MAG: metal-dependent hydrolase [Candidatus Omnitrophica bacterium]|nr:metal-dependent hydrolase [Candidatus Omnitrophota bacterium]
MASRGTHLVVGGAAGLGVYGFDKWKKKEDWTLLGVAGAILLGMFIALLPDIIEPAVNPNHRQFFHSLAFLIVLLFLYNKLGRDEFEKLVFKIIIGGCVSHLAVDATSPRGLPLA